MIAVTSALLAAIIKAICYAILAFIGIKIGIRMRKRKNEKIKMNEKEKEYYRNHAKYWNDSYYQKDNEVKMLENFSFFLGVVTIIEAISIAMLIWK